jgi:O-antigen ligase
LGGLYRLSFWGPVALGLLALLLAVIVARPASPRRCATGAVLGLGALWAWSLLSVSWAESADRATLEASRWLLYLVFFSLLVLVIRTDRVARLVLVVAGVVVALFGAYLCLVLILPGSSGLFIGARLTYPLGYVNGQAGYLLLGFWPLMALAERSPRHAPAGAALAGAVVLGGLAILAQTRAVLPAVAVSALALGLAVPGRKKRLWALVVVGAAVSVAAPGLLDVYGETRAGGGQVDEGTIRAGIVVLLLSAAVAGASWSLLRHLFERGSGARWRPERSSIASVAGLVAVYGAAGVLAVLAIGHPITALGDQVDAFKELDVRGSEASRSRFTSGGGNRYDYWRVAVRQFKSDPFKGLGAGNYNQTYFLERRTTEDIRQPHSIELQALAELGLVGMAALAVFVLAVLAGLARRSARARVDAGEATIAVGAGGLFLFWLVHTSVDWLHLIPGATGLALCAAACLVAPWHDQAGAGVRLWPAVVVVSAVLVLGGAVLIGRTTLADYYRLQAEESLDSDPVAALDKADRSLALNDEALAAYYVKAAAEARLGRYRPARAALIEATRREPRDFVSWALLGDLAVRRADFQRARRDYRSAARLNPRDEGLRQLAADPRLALRE